MRTETAAELADYLASQIPVYGSISSSEAQRILFRLGGLSTEQIMHAICVAVCRRDVVREYRGAKAEGVK